ncbi:1294_t:CDS:2, partial [Scutellospora calospora]
TYRNRLRDVLLEGVDIKWGKKCIGYEECENGVWALFDDGTREFGDLLVGADGINSPIPNLEIFDIGVIGVDVDIALPKGLADKMMKVYSNSMRQKSLGRNGDMFFSLIRLVPIDQSDNTSYRFTLTYHYPAILDIEDKNILVDDDNPVSVIKHTISKIKKLRPPCELTDMMIEIFSLVPLSDPGEKDPSRNYNPPRRRQLRDIDPLSVPPWKDDRIILLGDAVHAMNPELGLGANNAIKDAELLTKELINSENKDLIECIRQYNEQMRVRSSKDVLASRNMVLKQREPNTIPTILIIGAGIGGLSFYQSVRKNLNQKFN